MWDFVKNVRIIYRFPPNPPWAGLIGSKFDKRQRRKIFVATLKYSSQGAAHRNIIGFRCAAPERIRIKFATNIMVLCTFLEPFNPAQGGTLRKYGLL